MSAEDILSLPAPPADARVSYGTDPNQFLEVRLPTGKGPHAGLLNIHGGFWRARYGLAHAGHVCEALRGAGIATFNAEYRRSGNPGGGWPGTFADIRAAYNFLRQGYSRFQLDVKRIAVMGHSAGGQLAVCLAAHESSLTHVISLAGVLNLKRAFALHLSNNAVAEFLGGPPTEVSDHYREADPMELSLPHARQWLLHGADDDTVAPSFSRNYAQHKKTTGERIDLIELASAGHYDLIDPHSEAFKKVKSVALSACA